MRRSQRRGWLVWGAAAGLLAGCNHAARSGGPDGAAGADGSAPPPDGGVSTGPCELQTTLTADVSQTYTPFAAGNVWNYRGTISHNGGTPMPFLQTIEVTGTMSVGGVDALVAQGTNADDSGKVISNYLEVASAGLINHGNDDTTDPLTPTVVPYPEITFPIKVCSSFQQYHATSIDSGKDLDGDGKNERFDATSVITERALESTTVPAGTFANSLRLEGTLTVVTTASRTGQTATGVATSVDWYAPGVGPVKHTLSETGQDIDVELLGALVGGVGRGVVPRGTLAAGIAFADLDPSEPDRPAISFDGQRYLVVVSSSTSTSMGALQGIVVGTDGKPTSTYAIAQVAGPPSQPSAAFGGTNTLIAYQAASAVEGLWLDASGAAVGTPFAISNNASNETSAQPAVAYGGGAFLVAYTKYTDPDRTLWVARLTGPSGTITRAQVFPAHQQSTPAIASDGTGFLVVWQDTPAGAVGVDDSNIMAARLGSDGNPVGSAATAVAASPMLEVMPDVAYVGSGYVAAWFQQANASIVDEGTIRAARLDATGALLDGPATAGGIAVSATSTPKNHPRVGRLGSQGFVVWEWFTPGQGPSGLAGVRLGADGQPLDGSATDEGLWIAPGSDTMPLILPELHGEMDRTLVVWVTQPPGGAKSKGIDATMVFPF
jgi:hypothetical protein